MKMDNRLQPPQQLHPLVTDNNFEHWGGYPKHERRLLWNDTALRIDWPLNGEAPKLAAKDAAGVPLAKAELFA